MKTLAESINAKTKLAFLALITTAVATGCAPNFQTIDSAATSSDFSLALPVTLTAENFDIAYSGGGAVVMNHSEITLSPQISTTSSETHAALVMLKETQYKPAKNFELVVNVSTTQQLRQNDTPNDWEVFWLFFNYNGDNTNKTTNYFISKPKTGIELGIAYEQIGQVFLSNQPAATTAIGQSHTFKFRRLNNVFTVYRDDKLFYTYTNNPLASKKLYDSKGSIGFYTEDAAVEIKAVSYKNLD